MNYRKRLVKEDVLLKGNGLMSEFEHLHTVMIYLTEKCPLECGYCYFKDKRGRDLPWDIVQKFLLFMERGWRSPRAFIVSGGEPFLCWKVLRHLLQALRKRFPLVPIHVQTNGLFLNYKKLCFLRQMRVGLEFGIDGDEITTQRWRTPMNKEMFACLIENIRLALAEGISVGCTMTVHPDEVERMPHNLSFLKKIGIKSVDITPAAFMDWDDGRSLMFKRVYGQILKIASFRQILHRAEDLEPVRDGMIDISLHPPGYVLLGDAFLCLPEREKKRFSLWDQRSGQLKSKRLTYYQKGCVVGREHSSSGIYRDYVSHSFKIVNRMMGKKYLNTDQIVPLMQFLTRAHRGWCGMNPGKKK